MTKTMIIVDMDIQIIMVNGQDDGGILLTMDLYIFHDAIILFAYD